MTLRLINDPWPLKNTARLGIGRAEIEPAYPRERDRGGAHRARFKRDIKIVAGKTLVTEGGAGGANGQNFRMRGGIVHLACAVARLRHDNAGRPDDHSAHRHLAPRGGSAGLIKCNIHERSEFHGPLSLLNPAPASPLASRRSKA